MQSPDSRQQRPEFLGGHKFPIVQQQVSQTSSTDTTTPQGNTAAYSLTTHYEHSYKKGFTEHCIIMGFAYIRTQQTYQQGIEKG